VNIPAENLEVNYINGITQLKDIERMILAPTSNSEEESSLCDEFSSSYTEDEFLNMVEKVKSYISKGDVFQAVISNCFKAAFHGSLMNTYRILRTINPSPYMVYLRLEDLEIACSSPETLIALRNGELSSFPLGGTCPRGENAEEDAALIEALLNDEKELAEPEMLVDVAKSDIGKVSRLGSVKVRNYRQIKRLSHVSHISSQITGELRQGMDAFDVISAAFPAGTLTGMPKKRACEIIDSVEGIKRGVYGGAIGYIDFTGNMDMCIGIRMAVLKDGYVYVQAGAGIVADSVPKKEYRETQNKAKAVLEALKTAGEIDEHLR
jgi:anthranilate synthase component 1